jgi:hypothetical protein
VSYYIPKEGEGLEEGAQKVLPPSTDLFAYEWDTHGNWVKQVVTTCSGEPAAAGNIGTYTCKPASVTSRTITYYDEGHADK